jgi:hypothetical protein
MSQASPVQNLFCSVVFSSHFTIIITDKLTMTIMGEDDNTQQQGAEVHSALTTLQPIRDLAKNWDIDIASWYVVNSTCRVRLDSFRLVSTKTSSVNE